MRRKVCVIPFIASLLYMVWLYARSNDETIQFRYRISKIRLTSAAFRLPFKWKKNLTTVIIIREPINVKNYFSTSSFDDYSFSTAISITHRELTHKSWHVCNNFSPCLWFFMQLYIPGGLVGFFISVCTIMFYLKRKKKVGRNTVN